MSKGRGIRRAMGALAAGAALTGVLALVPASPAGANPPMFDYEAECISGTFDLNVAAGAGILSLGGVGFNNSYIADVFCEDYTPGYYTEENGGPEFVPPTYDGENTEDFEAYLAQLAYAEWKIKADLGSPNPGEPLYEEVQTAGARVAAYMDAVNSGFVSILPTHITGHAWDRGFHTWINGGNWGYSTSATLANGDSVGPMYGTWHPMWHNFNVISPNWAADGALEVTQEAAVGAGCVSGSAGSVKGYGVPGSNASGGWINQRWNAMIGFGCGLFAGTSAGDGGGVFVGASAGFTAYMGAGTQPTP